MSDVFRTASPASKDTHDPPAGELFCMGVRDDVEFTKPFLFCMLQQTVEQRKLSNMHLAQQQQAAASSSSSSSSRAQQQQQQQKARSSSSAADSAAAAVRGDCCSWLEVCRCNVQLPRCRVVRAVRLRA
jgi:hypothetical protein